MKKTGFIIRWIIIFLIVWTLVWSGVKVGQGYFPDYSYSGFPYKYFYKSCDEIKCNSTFNSTGLILDIAILLAVSLLITLFSYQAKKKID